jgi:PAS domain S-box-containing protein
MQAPPSDPALEIKRLQRCMNDLVSVLALPAVWRGREPAEILATFVDSLMAMLNLDFSYARVIVKADDRPIEVLRVGPSYQTSEESDQIAQLISEWLKEKQVEQPSQARRQIGSREIAFLPMRMGVEGELGFIVTGSHRASFPEQTEKLIMSVASNQAAIGIQQAQRLNEQKRVSRELDVRVAQRTAELAAANEVLRKEIAERKEIEERLREEVSFGEMAADDRKIFTGFIRDISEKKRAEKTVIASERNLSLIINTMPVIAWSARPDGNVDFFNQRWLDYTGLTLSEAHDWGWAKAFHPDDLGRVNDYWRSHILSGEPAEMEARIRKADGSYRWFLVRGEVLRDESGAIIKWYGTNTDIEDRKRAEEELLRKEEFLAKAQSVSATGSFAWCAETDEITISDEASRIFGFEPDVSVTSAMIHSRIHPDDIALLTERRAAARNFSEAQDYEIRLQMPDGSVKYLHSTSDMVREVNGRREYIGAIQDVTQRRHVQEALNKAQTELAHVSRIMSLNALAASIAHEINQPLSGIVTNAGTCLRMLNTDPPSIEGARETVRRTIRDANRASDVITRLRSLFSRKEVSTEPVHINEIAREVLALLLSELQQNRVVLQPEFADGLPRVKADRVQIQQVVLNLLRNASDAMSSVDDRPRQLLLKTELDCERVRVSVQDSGGGFDATVADRLFESFYTTKPDGMGIGLSVSRSIIEAHGGRLWATVNDGPGATFAFSIPCEHTR